jgi:hypothetical protein
MADARLEVTDALGRRIVPIAKSPFEIGRRKTNDLQLAGSEVSRDHAEVTFDGDRFTLHDRNSRYGTYVNGEQVTERVLVHGDKVRLGRTGGAEMVFLSADRQQPHDPSSDVAGVALVIERRLNDEEYYGAIAAALERDTVHCPDIDSAELQRQLQDRYSWFLRKGFDHVVEFDARAGCDARGGFDSSRFLRHISGRMSDAFGLHLPHDEFHPEEISQVLKDERRSLFCVLNVKVVPSDQLRSLRGFGQEHHRMLLCGPHLLDGVKAKAVEREELRVGDEIAVLLERLGADPSGRALDDLLSLVLDSAIEVSGAERGFIMACEGAEVEFMMARGRGRITLSVGSFATSRKIPEEVFRTGEPRIVADLLDLEGDLANVHMGTVALGIRNVLCVPLRLVRYVDKAENVGEGRRSGVLYLDSREKGSLLSGSTRAALETLLTKAAVAIENQLSAKRTPLR